MTWDIRFSPGVGRTVLASMVRGPGEPAREAQAAGCGRSQKAQGFGRLRREVSRPISSCSLAQSRAEQNEAVKMNGAGLRSLGFTATEAHWARENLRRQGHGTITVADCNDLFREAFRPRY
jgi:hypothetical protein